MIAIAGSIITPDTLMSQYPGNSIEAKTLERMAMSSELYNYASIEHLKFELSLRKNIVTASMQLYASKFAFSNFRESYCNENYWKRTNEGGFLLLDGVRPSEAIRDIYKNSALYGIECATGKVIVFYKALVEILPEDLFDRLFPSIYLMNWQHLSRNLGIFSLQQPADYFPGDCRYIRNPDVDPLTPEWQGENIIDLGNGTYYGHGIGITTINRFISILNEHRKAGAQVSAYLMDQVTRIDFKHLADLYLQLS